MILLFSPSVQIALANLVEPVRQREGRGGCDGPGSKPAVRDGTTEVDGLEPALRRHVLNKVGGAQWFRHVDGGEIRRKRRTEIQPIRQYCSTVLYCTRYSTVQYSIYSTVLYSTIL